MMIRVLEWLYAQILFVFPPAFRAEYQEEMQSVFAELLAANVSHTWSMLALGLRELFQAPPALLRAYRLYWGKRMHDQLNPVNKIPSDPGLDTSWEPPDGRTSWVQALLEISLFVALGVGLVFTTYQPLSPSAAWARGLGYAAVGFVLLPLLIFSVGIIRGLPRWAFPSGGLIFGALLLGAALFGLLPALAGLILAVVLLGAAAVFVNAYVRPVPLWLRKMGEGLSRDWTRLAFAVYGLTPLLVMIAFDDSHYNNQTPWYALSFLAIILGALGYSRSRSLSGQLSFLFGGLTAIFCASLLDQAHFHQGLFEWFAESTPWLNQVSWLLRLWANALLLLLLASLPALLKYLSRARQTA